MSQVCSQLLGEAPGVNKNSFPEGFVDLQLRTPHMFYQYSVSGYPCAQTPRALPHTVPGGAVGPGHVQNQVWFVAVSTWTRSGQEERELHKTEPLAWKLLLEKPCRRRAQISTRFQTEHQAQGKPEKQKGDEG